MRAALLLLGCAILPAWAAELQVWPEYLRIGPDGEVVAADRAAAARAHPASFVAARAGYVSFQVVARFRGEAEYTLDLIPPAVSALQVDIFREWYHLIEKEKTYYPDALVPVSAPYRSRLPEPDNRVPNQQAQAFWFDIWVPGSAPPGEYSFQFRLRSNEGGAAVTIPLKVLPATVPNQDVVTIDHNSYGTSWISELYPKEQALEGKRFFSSDRLFHLIHEYHRIFYEHRGAFHQLV
jgi:hypothetical protein